MKFQESLPLRRRTERVQTKAQVDVLLRLDEVNAGEYSAPGRATVICTIYGACFYKREVE